MRGGLTAKGRATRERIIEGAAAVLRERGVASATLDDVMARTGTSKSQLFRYFPSGKDELLLAVARFETDRVQAARIQWATQKMDWQVQKCGRLSRAVRRRQARPLRPGEGGLAVTTARSRTAAVPVRASTDAGGRTQRSTVRRTPGSSSMVIRT